MGGIPNILQCSHGLGGGSDTFFDVVVVTQAEGNEGAEILKVSAEGDTTIFNRYGLGFVQIIIQLFFSFPATIPVIALLNLALSTSHITSRFRYKILCTLFLHVALLNLALSMSHITSRFRYKILCTLFLHVGWVQNLNPFLVIHLLRVGWWNHGILVPTGNVRTSTQKLT